MPLVPADRYPRLVAYLTGLPGGLESYPDCQARSSLFAALLDGLPGPRPRPEEVPPALAPLLLTRPTQLWVREVHLMAATVAIADHYGLDDAALLAWLRERNLGYLNSLVVRVLMAFLSPAEFVQRAAARWGAVHRGSTLEARLTGPKEATLELSFPDGLFAPLLLSHLTAVFQAALEHTRANGVVELVEASEARGLYRARWS